MSLYQNNTVFNQQGPGSSRCGGLLYSRLNTFDRFTTSDASFLLDRKQSIDGDHRLMLGIHSNWYIFAQTGMQISMTLFR